MSTSPSCLQFQKSFSDRRDIPQIAAGDDDVVRHAPVALLENFIEDCFLPFDAKGIDGVDQVQSHLFGQQAQHVEGLVEVVSDFDYEGSEFEGLRELGGGDFSGWNKNDGLHSGARGVGGHRSRGVACRSASGDAAADGGGLGDASGHAQVLERAGWIIALVLDREIHAAGPFAGAANFDQRGAALGKADDFFSLGQERQKFAKSPDSALIGDGAAGFSLLPDLAQGLRSDRRKIVADVEQAAAGRAQVLAVIQREPLPAAFVCAFQVGGGHS